MNRLATLQIIWPPVPSLIFVLLFDWLASFDSMAVTFAACMILTYVMFAPALVFIFWPKKPEGGAA